MTSLTVRAAVFARAIITYGTLERRNGIVSGLLVERRTGRQRGGAADQQRVAARGRRARPRAPRVCCRRRPPQGRPKRTSGSPVRTPAKSRLREKFAAAITSNYGH